MPLTYYNYAKTLHLYSKSLIKQKCFLMAFNYLNSAYEAVIQTLSFLPTSLAVLCLKGDICNTYSQIPINLFIENNEDCKSGIINGIKKQLIYIDNGKIAYQTAIFLNPTDSNLFYYLSTNRYIYSTLLQRYESFYEDINSIREENMIIKNNNYSIIQSSLMLNLLNYYSWNAFGILSNNIYVLYYIISLLYNVYRLNNIVL